MTNTVQAQTSDLMSGAGSFSGQTNIVETVTTNVLTATKNASDAINGLSELGTLASTIDDLYGGLTMITDCYSSALRRTGQGLVITAQRFKKTDQGLYELFMALDGVMQEFTAPTVTPKTTVPKSSPPGDPWYIKALHWGEAAGAAASIFVRNAAQSPAGQFVENLPEEVPIP